MNIITYVFLLLTISCAAAAYADQSAPPLFEPKGRYAVGFRTLTLDDPWHKNNLILNTTDIPAQRQVLVNIWYPTQDPSDQLTHADYLRGVRPYEKAFLQAYDRFRRLAFYQETFPKTGLAYRTPLPQGDIPPHAAAFQRVIPGKRDAKPAEGKFPLIFYHSGAQGGFEENAPLLEFFAQHGYVSAAVLGSSEQGEIDASRRSPEWMWNDVLLALDQLKADPHVDTSRMALLGFSYGAQASLKFLLKQANFRAAILLDTTLENQDFTGIKSSILDDMEMFGFRVETPILALSEVDADFKKANRFRIYEPLTRAPRILVDFGKGVAHDDFTWHGLIKRSMETQIDQPGLDSARNRYAFIAGICLEFLNESFSAHPGWSKFEDYFQKSTLRSVYREITNARREGLSFQELNRILQGDINLLKSQLQTAIGKNTLDPAELSGLISHVRYTNSSLKALQICEALPLDLIHDELQCASIALENHQPDLAEKYVSAFTKRNKKPSKKASEWEHMNYADAKTLRKLIKTHTETKTSR